MSCRTQRGASSIAPAAEPRPDTSQHLHGPDRRAFCMLEAGAALMEPRYNGEAVGGHRGLTTGTSARRRAVARSDNHSRRDNLLTCSGGAHAETSHSFIHADGAHPSCGLRLAALTASTVCPILLTSVHACVRVYAEDRIGM